MQCSYCNKESSKIDKCSVCNVLFVCENCLIQCHCCKRSFCVLLCQNMNCEKCFHSKENINYCLECVCKCPELKLIDNFF